MPEFTLLQLMHRDLLSSLQGQVKLRACLVNWAVAYRRPDSHHLTEALTIGHAPRARPPSVP